MIVENQFIDVVITKRNIDWYKSLGYNVNLADKIKVKPQDLTVGSGKRILVSCDYCGEITEKRYVDYITQNKQGIIKKDCCFDCRIKKQEESHLKTYGVKNPNQREEVREKSKATNKKRYGHKYYFQTKEFKQSYKKIMNRKYGVDNAFQSEAVKKKIRSTNMEKYGVEYVLQNPDIKEKQEKTVLERFGYDNAMKNPKISRAATKKSRKTMYEDQTGMVSKQQTFIHNIIKGELNYAVDQFLLDIAYPELKIYVECDFSGHNLPVLFGQMTQEEFNNKELKRYYYLKNRNWKMIRIISTKDLLPSPNIISDIIEYGVKYLKSGHSWIKFNIDDFIIENSMGIVNYNYGELSKL